MIDVRPFATLGHANHGWLNARYHFAFGAYRNPARASFGRLRVWNDDEIAPGTGFDPHPHRDMEIITYVREGAITHKDNLGNEGRTEAGSVQIMSAGTGIVHAEYNLEPVTTRIFQIWIMPDRSGEAPRWGAKSFPKANASDGAEGRFTLLASGRDQDADTDALRLNADGAVLATTLAKGQTATLPLGTGRGLYLVPARGRVIVNGIPVGQRDGAAIQDEAELRITAEEDAELVLVEVAA